MAALVTGLVQIQAADSGDWTAAIVGAATAAIPFATSGSNSPGIDGTTKPQQASNQGTAVVSGTHYSLWSGNFAAAATYDFSAAGKSITLHIRNLSPTFTVLDSSSSDAYQIYLFSGSGSANYAVFDIQGSTDLNNGSFYAITVHSTLEDSTGGTYDDTDITGIGIGIKAAGTSVFGIQLAIDQVVFDDGVVLEDTGGAATVTMDTYFQLLNATGGESYHSLLAIQAGTTYEFGFGISLEADDYDDSAAAVGVAFKKAAPGFPTPPTGYYAFDIIGQAAGSIVIQNMTAATLSPDFTLTIDGSAATTVISITSMLVAGVSTVVIGGAGTTIVGGTLSSPNSVDISDGDLELTILDMAADIQWTADLIAGSTITTASDIDITFAETDLSDINLIITGNNTINVEPTTGVGTYDLSGALNTGFTTNFDIPGGNANDTTIATVAAFIATRTEPTTGGGSITLSSPATSYTLQLPNIVDSSRFQIYNVNTALPLTNSTTSGGTGIDETYIKGTDYTAGDVGRYRVTYQSGTSANESIEGTFTFPATTATNSIPTAQVAQATYNTHGVDGSAVTGITWDSGNLEFDFNEVDDIVDGQDIGSWYYYYITTATGIDEVFGAIFWAQVNKITNVTANVDMTFDNVSADALQIINCWIDRDDGVTIISATSNSIQIDPPAVFIVETGVSGLTSPESAQLFGTALEATLDTLVGIPAVSVSADILAVKTVVDLGSTQVSVDAIPTAVENRQEMDANSTQLAAILTDTGTTIPADTAAIKAKTDSLTFTKAGEVDSNGKSVNGTTVTGSGTAVDPWGP